jgi:hypothetical protein
VIVIAIGCDCCNANTVPYRIPFGVRLKHVLRDMRQEAVSLGWERVRPRTWFCPTCRYARNGGTLVPRKTADRQDLAKPGPVG